MKLKMYFLLLALGALGLQSCNDDDDHLSSVPTELKNAFTEKYPSVSNEKWETKGNYYIAEFRQQNYETSAWFTPNGIWQMTETDLPYQALPAAVKSAFESSEYTKWKVDDVDMLERPDMEKVYVIEVESKAGIRPVLLGRGYPGEKRCGYGQRFRELSACRDSGSH